jgi:hypothetical protein
MKKSLTIMVAVFFLVLMVGGNSLASIQGWVYDDVSGYGFGDQSGLFFDLGTPPPSGTLGGTFTINAINFTTEGGLSTYTQFLSGSSSGAPGPNGLVWDNSTSATFGANAVQSEPDGHASFFQFFGVAYFSENFSITKDDGFVLYIKNYGNVYDAAYPTGPLTVNMSLATYSLTPGYYEFLLNYATWNGFPEVLKIESGIKVPEPTTLLLLGFGLIGVAGLRRIRR